LLESKFQSDLIKEIRQMFEGCVILKNDANYMPGVPDLTVLWRRQWAMLEVKESFFARRRPNQEYYVDMFDKMSFAVFVCPENKEEVLDALQSAFGS